MIQHRGCDGGGTTSPRFYSDKPIDDNKFFGVRPTVNNNRIAPSSEPKVRQRDRDLGQTFLTGESGFKIDAIYLRLGFTDKAVLPDDLKARLAQPPGTLGFPDVCTWWDLYFTITTVPGSRFLTSGL